MRNLSELRFALKFLQAFVGLNLEKKGEVKNGLFGRALLCGGAAGATVVGRQSVSARMATVPTSSSLHWHRYRWRLSTGFDP